VYQDILKSTTEHKLELKPNQKEKAEENESKERKVELN